ncbi:hypothetical protein Q8F55_008651 [Vanrija albida]|uniref:F-box domain-containing protein n=1 Tax=Vanrija albida TaxID=181172 RepID=A0ABR3PRG4_9TREE
MALDASAYPHLMDAILGAAPYSALLALRGTSKAFLDRIDRVLFRHLVLALPELDDVASRRAGYTISSVHGTRLPVLPVPPPEGLARHPASWRRLLAVLGLARIIDFHSGLPQECLEPLGAGLTRIDVVRMLPRRVAVVPFMPYRIPFKATTLVFRAGAAEPTPRNRYKLYPTAFWSDRQVSRVVIHTFYELGGVSAQRPIISPSLNHATAGLEELVLLFTALPKAAAPRLTAAAEHGWQSFQTRTLAENAADACINNVECTVVGLSEADPCWFEFSRGEDLETRFEELVTNRICRHLQSLVGGNVDVPQEYIETCLRKLSFVSREEYERGRDPEQVALERCM